MSIEGAVVTIDAMGCQRNVAARIIREKGRLHSRPEGQCLCGLGA
jgi:predicted transposase YbfD/YdcC